MRPAIALICTAVTVGTVAGAEPVSLICAPEDQSEFWRVTAVIDPEAQTVTWNHESWDVIRFDERMIAARRMQSNQPATLLINRETGRFWQTQVGRFCNNSDCSSTVLSSLVVQGTCTGPEPTQD